MTLEASTRPGAFEFLSATGTGAAAPENTKMLSERRLMGYTAWTLLIQVLLQEAAGLSFRHLAS
jgi:hypothetical protein